MNPRITRKEFLGAAAATAVALGTEAAAVPAPRPVPVIDTHTHFYDPTRAQGVPWPPKDDKVLYNPHLPPQFAALTHDHNVVGTVVVEASPWLEDNQWILDLARHHPVIVGFIGNLEPGKPEFAAHSQRFRADPIFRGLRVGGDSLGTGLDSPAFVDDLRRLADAGLTLDVVGDATMLPVVARLARLLPDLRIVIDHLPLREWNQDTTIMRRALADVAGLPNVYAKISDVVRRVGGEIATDAAFYRPRLDLLWELFGPDRAMYGSNWPVSDLVAPYDVVFKVVADYFGTKELASTEQFFWKNSLAAYRWQPRGSAAKLNPIPDPSP